ncbi:MAG: hypothetical protein E6441_12340 [Clostridium sp.]|uniref:hypothetical protein n=1 Tax=Clostridium sp. TaxID=1506 RepID=UPI0029093C69|nr:hypothetical protein [Clostridium sp.]MDU5211118.1 hypothetical protein [Clostridium sp.]MDU6762245.1 hypothetical protein [Clostridium sp.]
MNKCPRCENENLKEDYRYCPVCGVKLGTAPEVPVQEQYVKNIISKELFEIEKKRYKELKLFYFMNMLMFICLALNSISMLMQ